MVFSNNGKIKMFCGGDDYFVVQLGYFPEQHHFLKYGIIKGHKNKIFAHMKLLE